jgi:Protein of unknown function (DUF3300)
MIKKTIQQILSTTMCWMLVALGVPTEPALAFQDQAPQSSAANNGPEVAPQTADQLDALVAPIALYPDALVAQVLGAATYPDQVAIADYWLGQNKNLTGAALASAVDQQSWDASVKALTQFPDVLDDLAKNLAWASSLGQAFHNQQADVMAAVQVMRAKAQAAGTLKSSPQVTVVQQTPQTIVIQPANPQVVYVPQYDPTLVYGSPYVVPLYTPHVGLAAALSFGAGIAVGAAIGGGGGFVGGGFGGGFGWGFGSWGCNWGGGGGGGSVVFNHNTYISNNSWHGGNTYNGYHPWGPGPHGSGPYGPHPYGPNGGGNRNEPNGGRNGDHGLIGGRGGVQRQPDGRGDRTEPNGGRNGDRGLIGGNGGTQQQPDGRGDRANSGERDRTRSQMSRDGGDSRAESNRGRQSMHPQARSRAPQTHAPQNRGGGGGRRR